MKEIYLITDYAKLDGVLDLYTDKHIAEGDIKFYHDGGKRGETNLIKMEYDGRIFDYDREYYSINFFEKKEHGKGWATPYLDKSQLDNWGIKTTILYTKQGNND